MCEPLKLFIHFTGIIVKCLPHKSELDQFEDGQILLSQFGELVRVDGGELVFIKAPKQFLFHDECSGCIFCVNRKRKEIREVCKLPKNAVLLNCEDRTLVQIWRGCKEVVCDLNAPFVGTSVQRPTINTALGSMNVLIDWQLIDPPNFEWNPLGQENTGIYTVPEDGKYRIAVVLTHCGDDPTPPNGDGSTVQQQPMDSACASLILDKQINGMGWNKLHEEHLIFYFGGNGDTISAVLNTLRQLKKGDQLRLRINDPNTQVSSTDFKNNGSTWNIERVAA